MQSLSNQRLTLTTRSLTWLVAAFATLAFTLSGSAQSDRSAVYSGMQWRLIGPHRAGRVTAVAGIPGQPAIYYFGTPGGGLWKTTSGGRTWQPIFDSTHQAAIGALALAASDPNIIYVGTGENLEGNGVYKSIDAGLTWSNIGLRETISITSLIVDPHDPNIVIVGARGPFVPGDDRGRPTHRGISSDRPAHYRVRRARSATHGADWRRAELCLWNCYLPRPQYDGRQIFIV